MYRKSSFFEAGGENEKMISYGPEDYERYHRWVTLGYNVGRVPGALFHFHHWRGEDSGTKNPFFHENWAIYNKEKLLTKEQLRKEVDSWAW